MTHRHRSHTRSGPYGCAGQVAFVATCRCGAKRTTCSCHQCREQGTNDTGWYMPICAACRLRHPTDNVCARSPQLDRGHYDATPGEPGWDVTKPEEYER